MFFSYLLISGSLGFYNFVTFFFISFLFIDIMNYTERVNCIIVFYFFHFTIVVSLIVKLYDFSFATVGLSPLCKLINALSEGLK